MLRGDCKWLWEAAARSSRSVIQLNWQLKGCVCWCVCVWVCSCGRAQRVSRIYHNHRVGFVSLKNWAALQSSIDIEEEVKGQDVLKNWLDFPLCHNGRWGNLDVVEALEKLKRLLWCTNFNWIYYMYYIINLALLLFTSQCCPLSCPPTSSIDHIKMSCIILCACFNWLQSNIYVAYTKAY